VFKEADWAHEAARMNYDERLAKALADIAVRRAMNESADVEARPTQHARRELLHRHRRYARRRLASLPR
jgi:hypothetical protein